MTRPTPHASRPTPRRILIVRPSALGDVARTVPCLVSLREAYPAARIDWLVNAPFAPAIASHPALGEGRGLTPAAPANAMNVEAAGINPPPCDAAAQGVIPFDRTSAISALRLMRELKAKHYDMVIDLQGLARSGMFTRATGASQRVGYANAREMAWLAYNRRHHVEARLHAVDRMLGLLAAQGIQPCSDLSLFVDPQDAQWAEGYRAEHGLSVGETLCFAPTAQWGCKCWPIARYAELAERLLTHAGTDSKALVLAAPHEAERVKPMLDALGARALYPRTTVGRMMALIQGCRLLVCNDSAPLHLAVGLGVPTVSLFGPTDPALVGPYPLDDPRHLVLRSPSAVGKTIAYRHQRDDDTLISELTVDAVASACSGQLQR